MNVSAVTMAKIPLIIFWHQRAVLLFVWKNKKQVDAQLLHKATPFLQQQEVLHKCDEISQTVTVSDRGSLP